MRAYVVETSLGILALDESKKLIDRELYEKDPGKVADIITLLESGTITPQLTSLVERLRNAGYTQLVFESDVIASAVGRELKAEVLVETPSPAGLDVRTRLNQIAVESGFVERSDDWVAFTAKVTLTQAERKMRQVSERPDLMMAQAVNAVDELDKTTNLFVSRIREWYGLHFPELDHLVVDHQLYLKIASRIQSRDRMTEQALRELGVDEATARRIEETSHRSVGGNVSESDLQQIASLSKSTLDLYTLRKTYEDYVEQAGKSIAPNLSQILGTMLAARLIALAGGLQRLSRLPASTIQVLGAEKALFRSLKTGSRPPKHGVIFQYEDIHNAPKWQRGKIARALAGKLAIAARVDVFTGKASGDALKGSLEKRIAEIRQVYASPPERKPREEPRREERRGYGRRRQGRRPPGRQKRRRR